MERLAELPAESVHSVVTDPPYHLTANKKGGSGEASVNLKTPGGRARITTGFMGKRWDGGDIAFRPETWRAVARVLKPGGYLLAFGGTRTYHRMVCAIEDAGFEIRDQIQWIYGSGFPKSLDVSKAIDKAARGVPQGGADPTSANHGKFKGGCSENNPEGRGFGAGPGQFMAEIGEKQDRELVAEAQEWQGWGTALKPAHEPIVVARKPFKGTLAENVQQHGTGALNIDGCRIEGEPVPINRLEEWSGFGQMDRPKYEQEINTQGRWPANVIHDGSDEVLAAFPDAPGQCADAGSVARFFYSAKASAEDRNEGCGEIEPKVFAQSLGAQAALQDGKEEYQGSGGIGLNRFTLRSNTHPTVKPTDLMRWLVRLVTPPDGTVLDCFMGSGSTLKAALLEGFNCIGIDNDPETCVIARARCEHVIETDLPLLRAGGCL